MISEVKFYSNKSGPFATVFYLKNLNFDNELRLVNELQQPYLLVHQYDKRWEKFSSIFNEIKKKNLRVINFHRFGAPDKSRTHNLRSRNPALYPVEATGAI